jgi:hypothetical protein
LKRLALFYAFAAATLAPSLSIAQTNFFTSWENRVRETSAKQPSFPIPVIAPSSQLVQLVRFDFTRQITSTETTTYNFDNGKGFNFIPYLNTELDVDLPPFIQHNTPKAVDGAGDFSMNLKFRPFASNDTHHDYSAGGQLLVTGPTGSYKNGTARATFQPTLMGGKGFRNFAIQSTLGATLPTGAAATIGRPIISNTTAQYKVARIFWPEVELNSTFYHKGPNDGKNMTFLSPGLMVSKIKFRQESNDRLALIFGASFQIATSPFHSYNHALVFTSRFAF